MTGGADGKARTLDQADDFLRRWSTRKAAERDGRTARREPLRENGGRAVDGASTGKSEAYAAADQRNSDRPATVDSGRAEAPDTVPDLPDIDSLTADSDFSAFLQHGVPEDLRQKALRKLWRLDPTLANLDGLNDYDDDFTDLALAVDGIKTAYRVGKGLLADAEESETDAQTDGEAAGPAKTVVAEQTPTDPADDATPGAERPARATDRAKTDGRRGSPDETA